MPGFEPESANPNSANPDGAVSEGDHNTTTGRASEPLRLDTDQLRALLGEHSLRHGIRLFGSNAVIDCSFEPNYLVGTVEDDGGTPYLVEVSLPEAHAELQDEDTPNATSTWLYCPCPAATEGAGCGHIAALLLAYSAHCASSEIQVQSAEHKEVAERLERARREVIVTPQGRTSVFGVWHARSVTARLARASGYWVHLRSLNSRENYCECPDFSTNQLGTCKHIEAVLHRVRKRMSAKKLARLQADYPSHPLLGLDWTADGRRALRIHAIQRATPEFLSRFGSVFDESGWLRGDHATAGHRAIHALEGDGDAIVTPEAKSFVEELLRRRALAEAGRRIEEQIRRAGGHVDGVRARLYPYQVDGVAFLASRGRGLLADDMGLGKSLQAITAAHWLVREGEVRHVVIVCPSSLKAQWAREIAKFTDHEAVVVQGNPASRLACYRRRAPFSIMNYELVLRDWRIIQEELNPDLLILDEAQRIRNWRTQAAEAVKALRVPRAFVLTGTPLENRLEDLYSLMQVIDPALLGPLWRFLADHQVIEAVTGKVVGHRNLSSLRQRMSAVMLRRDRRLVAKQIPARIDQRLDVPLDERQREIHAEAMSIAAMLAVIRKRRPLTPSEEKRLLAAIQNARMACNAAGLVDKKTVGSPKLTELRNLLEQLVKGEGRKVVVFSQWERMTAMAEDVVRSLKLSAARLHGGVPSASRGALIEKFETDPGCAVFLSTDAGATGLNLQAATALIHLDLPFNPAVLDQRSARIHRLGQTEPVLVVYLIAADSYEEHIAAIVRDKRELFTAVVESEGDTDVVGLAKSSLSVLLDALVAPKDKGESSESADDSESEAATGAPDREEEPAPTQNSDETLPAVLLTDSSPLGAPSPPSEDDEARQAVVAIQRQLGPTVQQILIQQGGLLVVTTQPVDVVWADALRQDHPDLAIAFVDPATAFALTRLGLAHSTEVPAQPAMPTPPPSPPSAEPPLRALARRKLAAAEALLAVGQPEEATAAFAAAALAALAHRGDASPPSLAEGAVWVFAEALPKGWCDPLAAAALARTLALAQSPQVPAELAGLVAKDTHELLAPLLE